MNYNLKAICSQVRDLDTALVFSANDTNYFFGCPDGFQRIATPQKVKAGQVQYMFLPSLSPDHVSGFGGFYRKLRHQCFADSNDWKVILFAPKGIHAWFAANTTYLFYFAEVHEFPDNLDEECKSDETSAFEYIPET